MNYFSSVKIWVMTHNPSAEAFTSHEVKLMKKAVFKMSKHVPRQAPPLLPGQFKFIVEFLARLNPPPSVLIVALLITYFTFLRQSNIVPSSSDLTLSQHVLKFKDVVLSTDSLIITVRSTKTRSGAVPLTFVLPEIPGSRCCPVSAWVKYLATVRPALDGPAFLLPTGGLLTVRILTRALRIASTAALGADLGFTLHSLRRGASQACDELGLDLNKIKQAGTWTSRSVLDYVGNSIIRDGPAAISTLLG